MTIKGSAMKVSLQQQQLVLYTSTRRLVEQNLSEETASYHHQLDLYLPCWILDHEKQRNIPTRIFPKYGSQIDSKQFAKQINC